jgi:hypothetical protein
MLASEVYTAIATTSDLPFFVYNRSATSRLLMYLSVLAGVTQTDVVEAMLERLLAEMEDNDSLMILEQLQGHLVLFDLLTTQSDQSVTLATSVLLHLAHSSMIKYNLDSAILMQDIMKPTVFPALVSLLTNSSGAVLENVSVLLQKCSKQPYECPNIRGIHEYTHLLKPVLDMEYYSDFVQANIRSIEKNLRG